MQWDVTDADQVDAAFKQVEETQGTVEVLVANAGITADNLMVRISDDDWDKVIQTNLTKDREEELVRALSEPARAAVDASGLSRYRIAKELGIQQPDLVALRVSHKRYLPGVICRRSLQSQPSPSHVVTSVEVLTMAKAKVYGPALLFLLTD